MKQTALTLLLIFTAVTGFAQTAYDALNFSENNYEGTARSVAMGNAFTALGGDLGAVSINPAGSAVSKYSQITLTPGMTISANISQGVSPYDDGSLPYFERRLRNTDTDFCIPNIGFSFNWETGRKTGIRNWSLGVVMNNSKSWSENLYANGNNSTTSFMGQMADEATRNGFTGTGLSAENAFYHHPWKTVLGYQTGMISTFGGMDDAFVGASELIFENNQTGGYEISLGGPLDQSYGKSVSGSKSDIVINLATNISDFIYVGANLGINMIDYSYTDYFKESAVDPKDFAFEMANGDYVCFESMKYMYDYYAAGTGVYGKFGIIVTPGLGLRFGAAIQTPTITTIKEYYSEYASTDFSVSNYSASMYSPEGDFKYKLRSPWRANFGLAYTLGGFAAISVDYELSDYSSMRYKSSFDDHEYFMEVNQNIMEWFGTAHSLRAGLEIKPISEFAIRAGYGFETSPDIFYDKSGKKLPAEMSYQNFSFGLGYSSKGSFFADLACRCTLLPDEYIMPYADYIYDDEGYVLTPVPEIRNKRSLWKILLTVGWRF